MNCFKVYPQCLTSCLVFFLIILSFLSYRIWTLIFKVECDEYDSVPNKWILNDGLAKYPVDATATEIKTLAKGGNDIKTFEPIPVQIIKEYDTYEKCNTNAWRLNSHRKVLSESEQEAKGRGQRIKRRKHLSSDDNDESEEETQPKVSKKKKSSSKSQKLEEMRQKLTEVAEGLKKTELPTPPDNRPKTSKPSSCTEEFHQSTIASASCSKDSANNFLIVDEGGPEALDTPSPLKRLAAAPHDTGKPSPINRKSPNKSQCQESVKKQLFTEKEAPKKGKCNIGKKVKHSRGFLLQCPRDEAVLHILCKLSADVTSILHYQKRAKLATPAPGQEAEKKDVEEVALPECLLSIIPCLTKEDLMKAEEHLKDETLLNTVAQHFESLFQNDQGLTKTARNITREWMAKEVQKLYSLKGGHAQKKLKAGVQKKDAFNQLRIYTVIKKVVKSLYGRSVSNYREQMDNTIATFLTRADEKKEENPA
ncbi:unnamed protein product [Bemisia tabaci]|uniref:Uncharacterized protein n=2 Tax=Bemisia tabaci TaxID=7038 RepID=A0A9P0A7D4_BEMTA|nr:unnamed protein product [Bemisia tabaci]